jgi:thioester reductase-like protein
MPQSDYIALPAERMLVTGSSGFIGARVVAILLEYGFRNLRCFVRPSSELGRLNKVLKHFGATDEVEMVTGDLLTRDDCRRATEGVAL